MIKMLKIHAANINSNRWLKLEKKNAATSENCILRKVDLKVQKPTFKILCKLALENKQKWMNKELIILSRLAR